jgi:hypothetical protein
MANPAFDPEKVLGTRLTTMDKQELCEFISALCRKVVLEVGVTGRRGGIYPENISVNENGTICTMDYEVVEKKTVRMPELLTGIVKCPNPKCITNNEPMKTRLHVLDKEQGILQCHYCNKEVKVENVKLV